MFKQIFFLFLYKSRGKLHFLSLKFKKIFKKSVYTLFWHNETTIMYNLRVAETWALINAFSNRGALAYQRGVTITRQSVKSHLKIIKCKDGLAPILPDNHVKAGIFVISSIFISILNEYITLGLPCVFTDYSYRLPRFASARI